MDKKKLKAKVWKKFSEYIRKKECIETTGFIDRGRCVTCGNEFDYKQLQAGHFVDGRSNAVLFVEDIVHIQCYRCNCLLHGNKDAYTLYMLDRYGKKKVERFLMMKHIKKSLTEFELCALLEEYKKKIKELEEI